MTTGIFRGTCSKFFKEEFIYNPRGEILYAPKGDFDYSATTAISWAYKKSIESNSSPLIVCMQNGKNVNGQTVPLREVIIFGIKQKEGLKEFKKFFDKNKKRLPKQHQSQEVIIEAWKDFYS